MRYILLLFISSLFLLSCTEVSFPEAQPRGIEELKEVPASLRGRYEPYLKTTGEIGDTLIIETWGYHFKDKNETDWLGRGAISDSLVIKHYKNYYFINFRDEDQWVLRVLREKSAGVLELMSIDLSDEETRSEMLKKLGRKFKIREVRQGESIYYQINPTASQLISLINEGYFKSIELRHIK